MRQHRVGGVSATKLISTTKPSRPRCRSATLPFREGKGLQTISALGAAPTTHDFDACVASLLREVAQRACEL